MVRIRLKSPDSFRLFSSSSTQASTRGMQTPIHSIELTQSAREGHARYTVPYYTLRNLSIAALTAAIFRMVKCSAWGDEPGGMAEGLKAAVLENAVGVSPTGGSNPSPSAHRTGEVA